MPNFLKTIQKAHVYVSSLKPISPAAADHNYFNCFLKSKNDIEQLLPSPLGEASVLIIGCGYRYPDILLYSGCSRDVHGLDVEDVFYRDGFKSLYDSFRRKNKGYLASLYSAYVKRNGLREYYKRIAELSNHEVDHRDLNLTSYDGNMIPFEDGKFDAVVSNAVLEHVADLETFFSEIRRVTKTSGVSYHLYHNYYSFSGSHLPRSLCEKHPWGHLRGKYRTDPNHLNEVTIDTVSERFSSAFEVRNIYQVDKNHAKKGIDEAFCYEREDLLTSDIRKEMDENIPDELLLTKCYLLVGIKR